MPDHLNSGGSPGPMTTLEVREFYTLSLSVSEALLRQDNAVAVLRQGLQEVATLLHADMALLHLKRAGGFQLAASHGLQSVPLPHHLQHPSEGDLKTLAAGLWLQWWLPEDYQGPAENNYARMGATQAIAIGLRAGPELVGYAGFLFSDRADRSELMTALATLGAIWGLQYVRLLESERRGEAETRLRLYGAALENLHELVLITEAVPLDPPGPRIVYVNRRVREKTGYAPEELLGQTPRMLQGPQTDRGELDRMKAKLQRFEPVTSELLNYAKDGTPYWMLVGIHPFSSDGGPPTHFVSVQTDITERKRAEATAAYLAAIVTSSHDAIVGTDLEGIVTSWNASAERVFGYRAEEMVGQSILRIIPPERHQEKNAILARLRQGEQIEHYQTIRLTKDKRRIEVSLTVSPVCDSQGRVIGVSKIARDITEQKRADEHLRQVLEGTGAGVWEQDLRSRESYWSPEFRRLYGFTANERPDPSKREALVHPDDLPRIREDTGAHLEAGESRWTQEFRIQAAGEVRWLQDTVWVKRGLGGRPLGLAGVTIDVTERNTAAQRAAEYQQKLEVEVARLQSLRRIDQAIAGGAEMGLTAGLLLEEMNRQLGVERASLYRVLPGTLLPQPIAHLGPAIPVDDQNLIGEMTALAMRRRETVEVPFPSPAHAPATLVLVPLIVRGQVKGLLAAEYPYPGLLEAGWKEFLTTLAGQAAIALEAAELFEELQRSNAELHYAYDRTIEGWARALDLRDKETEGHSRRVTELALRLAQAMGIRGDALVHLRRGALLHDIGKMGVPDSILLKPGPLTPPERETMQQHTVLAQRLLQPIEFLRPALDIPLYHHERWDGGGYPQGLRGEEIPLAARIFAVVDVYDALSSDRPYRPAWPRERVFEHLQAEAGRHFDPAVVEAFLVLLEQE